jgi:hypothetical protein
VNAYEGFIHEMDDRRLRAKNRRRGVRSDAPGAGDVAQDAAGAASGSANGAADAAVSVPADGEWNPGLAGAIRWPSEGSLTFERAVLVDGAGRERAVFGTDTPLGITLQLKAHRSGCFNVILAASMYRLDGVFIANLISPRTALEMAEGERVDVALEVGRVPLGDARYVVSLSVFEGEVSEHTRYDLLSRVLEFEVRGNPPLSRHAVVQLDVDWRVGAEARRP